MIECDYEIIRERGDEKIVLTTNKNLRCIDNVVLIEGPNDSGKSTLLNVIAIGLYGSKNQGVNESLKSKMKTYFEKGQSLSYKIHLYNGDKSIYLILEKKDPTKDELEIIEVINGKKSRISFELFERKYNLIYDIPHDPVTRLTQLTKDIKESQIIYSNRIGALSQYISKTITEIRSGKDPNRIKEMQKAKKKDQTNLDAITVGASELEKEIEFYEKYYYLKNYNYLRSKTDGLAVQIERLDKQVKKSKKAGGVISKQVLDIEDKIFEAIAKNLKPDFEKATDLLNFTLPPKEKHYLSIWERIDLQDICASKKFPDNFDDCLTNFRYLLSKLSEKEGKDETLTRIKLYEDLITTLQNYRSISSNIPQLNMNVDELIKLLEKLKSDLDPLVERKRKIKENIQILEKIETTKKGIVEDFRYLAELRKSGASNVISGGEQGTKMTKDEIPNTLSEEKQLNFLQSEHARYSEDLKFSEVEYKKRGKPGLNELSPNPLYHKISGKPVDELNNLISEMKKRLLSEKDKITVLKSNIANASQEIERLEKKKPHRYQDHFDKLIMLEKVTNDLKYKFSDFNLYIGAISGDNYGDVKDIKKLEDYNEAISKYLGHCVPTIQHKDKNGIDRVYAVKTINPRTKIIITKENKEIHMHDMGTGRAQSAFLVGKLNTNDKRIMITLFDEIAMMDENALKPITDLLTKLYNENKLLAGVLVQRKVQKDVSATSLLS